MMEGRRCSYRDESMPEGERGIWVYTVVDMA